MEEAPTTPTLIAPNTTPTPPATPFSNTINLLPPPPPPSPLPPLSKATQSERDTCRNCSGGRLGLTKEVLSVHTQQEEQAFLYRFKDLSKLRVFDRSDHILHSAVSNPGGQPAVKR